MCLRVMSINWCATTNSGGIYCSISNHSMYIFFQTVLWDTSSPLDRVYHSVSSNSGSPIKNMAFSLFCALFRKQGVVLDGADGSLNHSRSE